jgi:rRNA small subunit pseudouridine methyltransferase Nep1
VLTVILAGCELELAPEAIAGHPSVRASAQAQRRRPSEVLLDQNLHGSVLRKMEDGLRRGRPDIAHITLLTLLESILNKQGRLRVVLHTRNHEVIQVRADTRLPRGEARFQGLISKVLREGQSQDKEPLMWSDGTAEPAELLKRVAKGPVVRLDENGTESTPAALAQRAVAGDLTVVLGAFPAGDFDAAWKRATPDVVRIWPDALNAWSVASEIVCGFRAAQPA